MELLRNKNDYLKPLWFVSWDDQNAVPFIAKDDIVYDLDCITKFLCNQFYSRQTLSSCDAFFQRDQEYYLIEFKNQDAQRIKPGELEKKAFMSFNLLRLEMDQTVSVDDAREHTTLFVVFRDDVSDQAPADGAKATGTEKAADAPEPKPEGETGGSAGPGSYKAVVDKLCQLAKIEDPILFGLRKMKGKFYQEIYTIPKSEFMNKWYPQLFPGT